MTKLPIPSFLHPFLYTHHPLPRPLQKLITTGRHRVSPTPGFHLRGFTVSAVLRVFTQPAFTASPSHSLARAVPQGKNSAKVTRPAGQLFVRLSFYHRPRRLIEHGHFVHHFGLHRAFGITPYPKAHRPCLRCNQWITGSRHHLSSSSACNHIAAHDFAPLGL